MTLLRIVTLLAAPLLLSSCASRAKDLPSPVANQQQFRWTNPAPVSNQLAGFATIIKFKPGVTEQAGVEDALDDVARALNAQIFYGRPMALEMHLVRVIAASTEEYEELMARLKAHPSVEFAEPDSVVRKSRP